MEQKRRKKKYGPLNILEKMDLGIIRTAILMGTADHKEVRTTRENSDRILYVWATKKHATTFLTNEHEEGRWTMWREPIHSIIAKARIMKFDKIVFNYAGTTKRPRKYYILPLRKQRIRKKILNH
ncbi:hypothetical protein KBC03_02925 [Patescibacteria group bacterium]|nr:hypothetical protein [Patescibacteria group bacterium]